MPRIRDIKSLGPFKGARRPIVRPKAASGKAPDYVVFTETEKRTVTRGGKKINVASGSREIWPEPVTLAERNVCAMGKGKVGLRACHVELVLLGPRHAPAAGVAPGAYLRFCETANQKNAPLVRVTDHKHAQEISTAYCACRRKGTAAAQCLPKNGTSSSRK